MDVMDWTEEKNISNTTIAQLDDFCNEYAKYRKEIDAVKDKLDELNARATEISTKIITLLNEAGKPSWKTEAGNFIVSNRFTVPTPKTPEDKSKFYDYLKARGIFEDMVSVHSQTLNGWYRQELDAALERGEVDFKVPGIAEPNMVQTLSVRKK